MGILATELVSLFQFSMSSQFCCQNSGWILTKELLSFLIHCWSRPNQHCTSDFFCDEILSSQMNIVASQVFGHVRVLPSTTQ